MFLLHPLGIEEREMDRLPWVSITLAALCAVAFAITWVLPDNPFGAGVGELQEMFTYWEEHPNAELPAVVREQLPPEMLEEVDARHAEALSQLGGADGEVQGHLDALAARYDEATEASLMKRLSLVPARGLRQWGWLTSMFLHFGWAHLLGNLFFFFLTGIMLEDAWGRPFFTGFYLVGGLVAGAAQAALDMDSQVMVAGASGAIAACMGAFAYRFASKRVRMGYFLWLGFRIRRGTFPMKAWVAGLLWFGSEVLSLVTGSSQGVAVMAHVGGFVFGLGTAVVLRGSGLEERYITPAVLKKTGNIVRPESLDRAAAALARGDFAGARQAAERVLAAYPDNVEARLILYQADRRERRPVAPARLEAVLQGLLAQGSVDALQAALLQLGEELEPATLRPATAGRMAQLLEADEAFPRDTLEALCRTAVRAPGEVGAWALLWLAERAARARQADAAREWLEALARREAVPAPLAGRAAALRQELDARASWTSNLQLATEPDAPPLAAPEQEEAPAAPALPPRFLQGAVVGESPAGLLVRATNGFQQQLAFTRILAVASGLAPSPAGAGAPVRLLPVTDLVLRWATAEEGPVVLRLGLGQLGLAERYPGVPARDAYARWLQQVLERSQAPVLADAEGVLRGQYPRYESTEAMTRALYGAASA